jgi:hypothetical protein
MTSNTNASSSSVTTKQNILTVVQQQLPQYFASTLNQVPDIVNIFMGLCYQEGALNPNIQPGYPQTSKVNTPGTVAYDYWQSTPIIAARAQVNPTILANVTDGLRAWGLTQVGGWNVVRGASKANGKTIIESSRPDLAGQLMVNPGDSIRAKYNGAANLNNMILAGLVILENKYTSFVKGSGTRWTAGNLTFNSRIAAAVAAYYGTSMSANPTPYAYSASVMTGGASYNAAKSATGGTTSSTNSTSTQPSNVSDGNNQAVPGC